MKPYDTLLLDEKADASKNAHLISENLFVN